MNIDDNAGGNGLFDAPDQTQHIEDVFGFGDGTAEPVDLGGDDDASSPEGDAALGAHGEGGDFAGSPPEPKPAAEPAVEAPPVPDDRDLELTSLRERLAALEAAPKPAEPAAAPAATPAAEPNADPASATPAAPAAPAPVNIKMPQQFKDALFGEDPEAAGSAVDQMVSGIYDTVNQGFHQVISKLPEMVASEVAKVLAAQGGTPAAAAAASDTPIEPDQSALEQMRTDYYKQFPNHNNDSFRPILAVVSREMAEQFPNHPWNTQYIASLGARVTKRAEELANAVKGSGHPAVPPLGARSAAPGAGSEDISDEIMDVLG